MKNLMFKLAALLVGTAFAFSALADTKTVYGIHLYFDEQEFVDVLTVTKTEDGVSGHMDVPNDFEGDVSNLVVTNSQISFDLFVPKNAGRPVDLIFHYEGQFFDPSQAQMAGFVTIQGQQEFVASFVGFKRD